MRANEYTQKPSRTLSFVFLCAFTLFSAEVTAQKWVTVTDPGEIMQQGYIQVIGVSEEKQSRFRAIRAATVIAQRDLLEAFQGVNIAGDTTIRDGMLQSDNINSKVRGFLRGAVKCGENYNREYGYAEVCMRLNIRGKGGAYDVILPLLSDQGIVQKAAPEAPRFIPKVLERAPAQTDTPSPRGKGTPSSKVEISTPSELSNPRDGLVLDVSSVDFKPAIVNRILTENGNLVFGPSQVVNSVLLDRGCGGFTNQSSKAKGLLATWGSTNPLILKAVAVKRGTDAVVDADSAAAIMTHDQKSNFLSQAKVVFVLR